VRGEPDDVVLTRGVMCLPVDEGLEDETRIEDDRIGQRHGSVFERPNPVRASPLP
jgi:hypothetical protein